MNGDLLEGGLRSAEVESLVNLHLLSIPSESVVLCLSMQLHDIVDA